MGRPSPGTGATVPTDDILGDATVVWKGAQIIDVGPAGEIAERHPDVEVIRLRGHALIPGLVNAHTHLAMTMFRGIADDVSLEDFLGTVLPLESRVLSSETVHQGALAAMVESHLAGVTTALDMYFFADEVMAAAGRSGFRALSGPVVLDGPGPDSLGTTAEQRFGSARKWLEKHPGRTDWRPAVGPHSTYLASPETLDAAGTLARGASAIFHIHAAETADEVALVAGTRGSRPVELLGEMGLLDERTVLAHGVHLTNAEMEAVGDCGASVVHCPASNLKLASGVADVPRLIERGVNVALGTDGAASSNDLDLLGVVRLAALLHKGAGRSAPDATVVSAHEALRMATLNGARALGLDGALGFLGPGAQADMVAIDLDRAHTQPVYDVFSAIVYAAGRGDVTDVWSRGVHVVAGPVPHARGRTRGCADPEGARSGDRVK